MITTSGVEDSCAQTVAVDSKLAVHLDTRGRVRVSKEQRRLIVAEFERSGLSAVRFAQQTGLKYSTFAAWVARQRGVKQSSGKSPLRLLEAVVASAPTSASLMVQLPGGARVELREVSQVTLAAALVRALEKPC